MRGGNEKLQYPFYLRKIFLFNLKVKIVDFNAYIIINIVSVAERLLRNFYPTGTSTLSTSRLLSSFRK